VIQAFCLGEGNNSGPDGGCQGPRPGGAADLIVDNRKPFPVAHQTKHGLDKIVAVGGIDPGGAQDKGLAVRFLGNPFFAVKFALAIDVEGMGFVLRQIRQGRGTVEDKIRRHMDTSATTIFAGPGNVTGTGTIDLKSSIAVGLGLINGSVGCGIDNHIRLQISNFFLYLRTISNVEGIDIHGIQINLCWFGKGQLMTELTMGSDK